MIFCGIADGLSARSAGYRWPSVRCLPLMNPLLPAESFGLKPGCHATEEVGGAPVTRPRMNGSGLKPGKPAN
jgi:hypothetical protein